MSNEQKIINELIEKICEIKKKAYYLGSCGNSDCDKIDIKCEEILDKYERHYIGKLPR